MRYVISPMQFLIENYTQNIYIFAWNDRNPIELNNNWSSISSMEQKQDTVVLWSKSSTLDRKSARSNPGANLKQWKSNELETKQAHARERP